MPVDKIKDDPGENGQEQKNSNNSKEAGGDQQQQQQQDSILGRKLKKILDSDLDVDSEMGDALEELSTFFTENTLRTRRFLRGDIERRSLQINRDFLNEMESVVQAVENVHGSVESMRDGCKDMKKTLEATKAKTRDLIRQTSQLREESLALAKQEQEIDDFIARYQLTEEEEKVLRGPGAITPAFYSALERCQTIHTECKRLAQNQNQQQPQTTALEIIEQMSAFQEGGLERLYRWTQSQCRSIETTTPETNLLVAQGMRHLQERPTMFKYVLDEYCGSRRAMLVRAFLDALTVGGPGGTPKPIELHAHEPTRYVGDMLAWLHQAIPSENENVRTLLKGCDGSKTDIEATATDCVSAITEDVCRPLKSRVEQILLLEASAVMLYKLTNLIRFYASTIKQVVSQSSTLVMILQDLEQLAFKQFMSVLQATVQQQRSNEDAASASHDLAPTPSTMALLSLLKETLSGSSVVDEKIDHLQDIVSAVVDPLLDSLQSVAAPFPTTDRDVFMLNSLYQIHTTLSLFTFNDGRLASLTSDMQLHLDTLASEQTSSLIANLGIQPVCAMVAEHDVKGPTKDLPLSKVPGMEQETLKQFLAKFDSFLIAPDVFLLPQARLLLSSAHRKNVVRRSLEVVAASYGQIYQAVSDPKSGYENPAALMPKTPEQVSLLLQL